MENKEQEILEQYTMRHKESESVKAWSKEYGAEDIVDDYLEKSGFSTSQPRYSGLITETQTSHKEPEILEQYIMRQRESDSVKAWTKEYGVEDIVDDYLEKSGYPTSQREIEAVSE